MSYPHHTRTAGLLIAALGVLFGVGAIPATAQEETAEDAARALPRAALGAGLGIVGGVGITVANVVARAHWQGEYLNELGDLIHWQSAPMVLAPATGVVFGLHGWETLAGSVIGSVSGLVLGAGVGAVVGSVTMETAEGPWAGGAMGGGWGLAVGGLVGAYIGWRESEGLSPPLSLGFSLPADAILPAKAP